MHIFYSLSRVWDKNQLLALLTNAYSKSTSLAIAEQAAMHKKVTKSLVEIVTGKDALMARRASWAMASLDGKQVNALRPYTAALLDNVHMPVHNAVIRNIIRAWQTMDIPENYVSAVYDTCLDFACKPQMAVAIRAFSITVCGKICQSYPELANELRSMMPIWEQDSSPAIAMRLREVKKNLDRQIKKH